MASVEMPCPVIRAILGRLISLKLGLPRSTGFAQLALAANTSTGTSFAASTMMRCRVSLSNRCNIRGTISVP
jgi:hypothetical protein